MASLESARRAYAAELKRIACVERVAVVEAFARTPRERFLGPGPWQLIDDITLQSFQSPDDDPRHVYRNVLVAIDPARRLNNGSPSMWAGHYDRLAIRAGERILHVGAGTGYYSAVLAEITGPGGCVKAVEIDAELAARAARNLIPWPQVELIPGDGSKVDPGPVDVIVINAGATHVLPLWLERLEPGGRILVPLTVETQLHGIGAMLLLTREPAGMAARFVAMVGIFPCLGARDPERNDALRAAYARGLPELAAVRSLRSDAHQASASCWLHVPGSCLSSRALSSSRRSPGSRSGR